jgi:hypothetical protein
MLHGRANIATLDQRSADDLDRGLEIRGPELRALPAGTVGNAEQPWYLNLGTRDQRRRRGRGCGQHRMGDQQLGRKPPDPAE